MAVLDKPKLNMGYEPLAEMHIPVIMPLLGTTYWLFERGYPLKN